MNVFKLLVSILACQVAGGIGAIFTAQSVSNWYAALNRPYFSPPNWIFAPVWTILYLLMGLSLYLVWKKGLENKQVKTGVMVFLFQLFLNSLWSFLFFGLQSSFYAFIGIIFLWLAILITIIIFSKISKKAAYLLLPYIIWVSFAALLNFNIWQLNP